MIQRSTGQLLLRAVTLCIILALAAFLLVGVLVILQGQRNEARSVDALLVIPSQGHSSFLVDHILTAYRSGYASRILLVGNDLNETRAALIERNQPAVTIFLVETSGDSKTRIRDGTLFAYRHGIDSVLIIDRPEAMLQRLKMARDMGFDAYGLPLPAPLEANEVVRASLNYWRYILFEGYVTVLTPDTKFG